MWKLINGESKHKTSAFKAEVFMFLKLPEFMPEQSSWSFVCPQA